MSRDHREPVRRRRVLAGTAVALALLAGLVALAEGLRHPPSRGHPPVEDGAAAGDPRVPLDCPEPTPDEARERPPATIVPRGEPVDVSSTELLNCPEHYDRRIVRYQGEAIGGLLPRRDGTWVQVNDDVYAGPLGPLPGHRRYQGANTGVGVRLPPGLAAEITTVGGPHVRGDRIEVVGVFRRVDPGSREVTVVHADSLAVIEAGRRHPDPPMGGRRIAAGILAVLAVAMGATERVIARRRQRR
ncbi:MAG: hypothetical protein WD250_12715 [Egibacteraceae bacterium]